ncbi:hypothetical protein ABAC460_22755 [Asticcacaulis sp. AC460]|uniref:hypothetical protein n=1 Tax=Asticcacaulis sp. AC460 TaxID=1282360 RepID=UPI0003C3BC87|nr:hypothetical protein [Asticcacaulis sp. AC460]ESQ86651.1 hypothetical protein ABAC460_22755 [Asticcacaulis sp. AC460]
MAEDFSPFGDLFETLPGRAVPGYLELLNLHDGRSAVLSLRKACATDRQVVSSQVRAMLGHVNWRVKLVAASAMIVGNLTECLDELWAALDRPCWTSPQLAATAALVDPDFLDKAHVRLNRRCPMVSDRNPTLSAIARHVAMGPASDAGHSAKLFSALFALCQELKASWLVELETEDDVKALLAADRHDGGSIALDWKAEITTLKNQTA